MSEFERASKFHGHVCFGFAVGYKAAKAAMKRLDVKRAKDEELVCIVENDSCAVDAIQFLTGCTFGKGNLFFKDYGKHAYVFARRSDGKAVRVGLRYDAISKVFGKKARMEKVLKAPDEEIFNIKEMKVKLPEKAKIYHSLKCSTCGEGVMETKARKKGGKAYCIPCHKTTLPPLYRARSQSVKKQ